jgi:hypothetical protein
MNIDPTFSQAEVFPMVARRIVAMRTDDADFVDHDAIVSALLSDEEGMVIVSRARGSSSFADHRSIASNMVAWFSQQITTGRSRWGEFFDRERRGGTWAYRPKTAIAPPLVADIELSAVEGDPRLFFHLRRERDTGLAKAKRVAVEVANGRLECEACGFVTQASFPG